jgi:Ser/Thr protein kinase RdoA (MazF antagonist)
VQASLAEARAELAATTGEERRLIDLASVRIERDAAILLPSVTVPRLVHRDLHPGNVLVEGDAVTAVIDFEMVREWDAAYDFVKIDNSIFIPFPEARVPFLAGYHEQVPPERDFASRVRLYQGLYCLLTAADFLAGNDGHRDWLIRLRRWLRS